MSETRTCGGCFSDMEPLKITGGADGSATDGPVVGHQCVQCGRVYLTDLINGMGIRLDRVRDSNFGGGSDE